MQLVQLPPEVLHLVCERLLDEERSLCALRLTCRRFDAIASCHAFTHLAFYLHQDDFAMLRHFAAHPIISRNVQFLVYFTDTLEVQPLSYRAFVAGVRESDHMESIMAEFDALPHKSTGRRFEPKPKSKRYSRAQLKQWHDDYLACHAQQAQILDNALDFVLFRDIVPQFTCLSGVVVAAAHWFNDEFGRQRKRPFDRLAGKKAYDFIKPTAVRQIDSLVLGPAVHAEGSLRILRLGEVDWSFLHSHVNNPRKLDELRAICCNLHEFELAISTGSNDDEVGLYVSHVTECRAAVERGNLRSLVGSMTELRQLSLSFTSHGQEVQDGFVPHEDAYAASLSDLIPEGMRWEKMQCFRFLEIEGTRQEFEALFQRHVATLAYLAMNSVRLVRSSWVVFLSRLKDMIRGMSNMKDVVLAGALYGVAEHGNQDGQDDNLDFHSESEDALDIEYFNLGDPEIFSDDREAFEHFKEYLLRGVGPNPLNNYEGFPPTPG